MKIVTVSRKPVAESSATANVVAWEAGALNIDGSRIGKTSRSYKGSGVTQMRYSDGRAGLTDGRGSHLEFQVTGRWPANVMLQHRSGCRRAGTQVLPGYVINRFTDGAKPFGDGAGHEYESQVTPDEIAEIWECVRDCPVAKLNTQSTIGFGDPNSAARYFKQMQETGMAELPQELWDYLATMISAPPSCEPLLIVSDTLEDVEWGAYEDQSVHGMVTVGNPEAHMKEIDRVLRPGAHLLVIAPDEEPSGHTGACAVEDFGYEIRDAIAVLDAPDEFYYIPKPSTAEKNAGVAEHLDPRTKKMVQNNHETVKSIAIMEALLQDIPKDALVVDPFLGSGTTSLACLRTGHHFIGIEQEAEYIQICDQRARYWDRAFVAWQGATIESEAVFEKEDEEPVSVGEFFGF